MDLQEMRSQFWTIKGQIDAMETTSTPLRATRDAHVQAASATEAAMNAEIVEAETGLFDLKQELAFLARGLGGQVGEPIT